MVAILVAAVAMFAFGALWFTVLFGKTWSKLMGFTMPAQGQPREPMTKSLILNFLINVLVAWVISFLFPQLLALSYGEFFNILFIIWIGFSFPVYANAAIWEKKSWRLVAINCAGAICSLAIASSIIYFMM